MKHVQRQNLDYDYTVSLNFGFSYEFKLWKNLHFRGSLNFGNINTKVKEYRSQIFSGNGKFAEQIGDIAFSGSYYEIPLSFSYYLKSRSFQIEFGSSLLINSSGKENYIYMETRYQNFDGDVLEEPITTAENRREVNGYRNPISFFVGVAYNYKLGKYRYLTFLLRYGDLPFTGSTIEAIVPRFLAFSVGYKFN